jgi:hypothetical protein
MTTITAFDANVVGYNVQEMGNKLAALSNAARADINALEAGSSYYTARGCVLTNMSTTAFVVAQNGVTYVENDVVLLCGQTTTHQNGPWVVGPVAGTAALSRPAWWAAGKTIPMGAVFQVGPTNTLLAGSTWKVFSAKAAVVGTDNPAMWPQVIKGVCTLISGTVTLGNSSGIFLKSTTESSVQLTRDTSGNTTNTITYQAPVATRTAGVSGTGAVTIIASVAAGTINVADTSTLSYLITNW